MSTHHAASKSEWIVRQDGFGRAIVVLGGDAPDEALDVQLCGAGLLARGVRTLQATVGLPESGSLAQRRVLDVLKVLVQVGAGAAGETKLRDGILQFVCTKSLRLIEK